MKKYLIVFSLIIVSMGLFAQNPYAAITLATGGSDSVIGKTATTITLPAALPQEYDYSYQIIPTKVGSGDSVNAAVALWVSNDYAGTSWTELTSARDTITSTNGLLIEGTDAKNMRHRLVLTGTVLDTSKVKIYQVYKLDKPWNQ
jgi:hypothetical protein